MSEGALHLYTVILDYCGGTYVSQVAATHENAALKEWLSQLRLNMIADAVSEEVASAFGTDPEEVVELQGLVGVWYSCAFAGENTAEVNMVRTAA